MVYADDSQYGSQKAEDEREFGVELHCSVDRSFSSKSSLNHVEGVHKRSYAYKRLTSLPFVYSDARLWNDCIALIEITKVAKHSLRVLGTARAARQDEKHSIAH